MFFAASLGSPAERLGGWRHVVPSIVFDDDGHMQYGHRSWFEPEPSIQDHHMENYIASIKKWLQKTAATQLNIMDPNIDKRAEHDETAEPNMKAKHAETAEALQECDGHP